MPQRSPALSQFTHTEPDAPQWSFAAISQWVASRQQPAHVDALHPSATQLPAMQLVDGPHAGWVPH